MSANFNVRFIVNEVTNQRLIELTDSSTGFTLKGGIYNISFPDGSTLRREYTVASDTSVIRVLAVTDINNNILTGNYSISYVAIDTDDVEYNFARNNFDYNFIKPSNGIINTSDVVIPEVKFKDTNSYNTNGSFSGTIPRSVSTDFPSTSAASGNSIDGGVNDQEIDVVLSGNYYEGLYTVTSEVDGTYTHDSNSWLTVYYKETFSKEFAIKKCPNQDQLIAKINIYRAAIEAYEDTNDTQYNTLNEQYDLAIALYSHIIARFNSSTADGSEGQLRQLLSILEPYEGSYSYQSGAITGFALSTNLTNSFTLSDGTTTDTFLLGETMVVLSGNAGIDVTLTDNQFEFTPVYGTTANTIAQGNDSRFHSPVAINTANGLSLAGQNLSLATATTSTSGAMSFTDKAKLDSIDYGAKTGTVTSVGLGMPSAFTVTNSPVTTSGTLLVTGAGTIAQYITGVGTLATLDTDAVAEGTNLYYTIARFDSALASKTTDNLSEGITNLYFTNARSRGAISVSGSLAYNSTTGVISYTTPSETDPIYTASSWYTTTNNSSNWNTAYGWGDHSLVGYLTSFTETDPIFVAHVAYGITATNISNWNTAYGWGDHSTQGYLTSYTETDPIFSASAASGISSTDINNWTTAYNWGDHSLVGYLTSESDPIFVAHPSYGITSTKITNWDTAYGWGDHSTQGYATQTYVGTQIAALVDSAPTTLDTLNELAAALGDDPNFATTVTNSIATKVPLTRTLTINGVSYDLTADRSWTINSMVYPSAGIAISTGTAWGTSQPTSRLLPAGGAEGQLIAKASATDYDFEFINNFAPQIMHEVKLGAAMSVGTAVYVSSADGTNMIVSKASNASESTSSKTLGLLASGGSLNDIVYVVTEGLLAGLDTSLATAGDPVWLGTNGALLFGLSNKPVTPAHLVFLGVVTRAQQNNGEIFVKVQNGFEFGELHDVLLTSETNNEILAYESSTGLWKNKSIVTALGYTPYDATNPDGYISSYTETDPVYTASSWYTTTNNSANWNTAYGWGDHASAGYLTSYTETDPIYTASSWYTTTNNSANWNTAYGWGDHSTAGYLTSETSHADVVVDGDFVSSGLMKRGATAGSYSIVTDNSANWNTAYGWGDHASAGYLTSYTETDPIFVAHPSYGITSTKITNWDTAYGWGNHATAGYVPSTRTLTINGTTYDLSANRSWTISAGAFALGDATDVTITTPSSGNLLQYNGTAWVNWSPNYITGNQTITLSGDATGSGTTSIAVTLANSGVTAGSYGSSSSIPVITVDAKGRITSATTQAVNIVSTLAGLSDTTMTTPSSGQLLQYNGTAWVNWSPNYLTSYTETDPIYTASSWYTTTNNSSNWNTAYSWGNHASVGYLTSLPSHNHDDRYYTETEVDTLLSAKQAAGNYFTDGDSVLNMSNNDGLDYDDTNNVMRVKYDGVLYNIWSTKEFSSTNVSNWNTAYGWGNHASAGYLTSYTETDTLATVTARGSSTTGAITVNGNLVVGSGGSSYITMRDSDEGDRDIHCNSNRIGFLTQAGGWGAWLYDGADWEAGSSSRAPIFYDSNNTAYYADPSNMSSMWGIAIRGDNGASGTDNQIFFWGSGNTTTSAIGFKSNAGYFTNPTGSGDGYNTYLSMDTDGRGWVFRRAVGGSDFGAAYTSGWILNNGVWQSNNSMRSPIFYDSNNTGYYVDPDGTSNFNALNVGGSAVITAGNIGSQSVSYATSAGNADTVDGYHVSTTRNAANTIPVRDANGYLQLGWINTTSGATTSTINKIYASTDDYIRYVTPATLISQLGLITTSTIGSQSVSYASSAGSVAWSNVSSKPATWLTTTNLIEDKNPSDTAFPSGFYQWSTGSQTPTGTWFNYINVRHSNVGNGHGFQLGMSYYDSNLWFRSYQGATSPTFAAWNRALGTTTDPYPANMNQYVRTGDDVTHNRVYHSSDSRAPIFYDQNNTGYYVDPASTSNLNTTTTSQSYTNGWFRNNANNTGLYNQNTTQHLSSTANGWWDMSSTTTTSGIRLYTGGHLSALRGHIYADSSSNSGLLSSDGNWKVRVNNSEVEIYNYLYAPNVQAYIMYDRSNTGYYVDPASTSNLNAVTCVSLTETSSIRYKENIVDLHNSLDKVLNMRGVAYNRKGSKDIELGVIAEEVADIVPEIVNFTKSGDADSVSYGRITALLIESIKEQQKQIDKLKELLNNK